MKKWLITTLLVIACVFGLLACGSSEAAPESSEVALTEEQEQQWYDNASQFVLNMHDAVQNGQAEAQMDDPLYGPAFTSWKNAIEDIGEVQGIEGKSCHFTKKEGTVVVRVIGSRHDAEVVFTMEKSEDQSYKVTGITTNVEYSMKEKIQQAGLNTLLGMGTTFAVLILLALVIALFGKVVGGASNRTVKKTVVQQAAPKAPALTEDVQEDVTDDTELVAVIAAAIAAYEGRQNTDGFVVRSIRKARSK